MFEDFLQRVLHKPYGLVLLAFLLAVFVRSRLREKRRVKVLGGNAPRVRSFLPFGLDTVASMINAGLQNRDLEMWWSYFKSHGPNCQTVQFDNFGLRCVFTHDPENIKAVLSTQFEDFGKGSDFHRNWEPFLGDSIFTSDGPQWRASRQLIRPQFLKERVSDLSIFERHVQVLLKHILSLGNGASVELNDLFFRFTLETSTEFLFGQTTGSIENPDDEFSKAFAEVQRIQALIMTAGPISRFIPRSSYYAAIKTIDAFIDPLVEKALAPSRKKKGDESSDEKYIFLHALADFTQDPKVLRDQLVAVLLAARDTTAAALSWAFYALARNPRLVEKLREEIAEVLGFQKLPTYENLKSMKYLQAVINETLRVYPVLPWNVRVALRDTSLPRGSGSAGQLPVGVLKDTRIVYSTVAMQRSGAFSPEFNPERWFEKTPVPWTYIPFHGGPRTCPGQQFALAELGYTITRILQTFDQVENLMSGDREDPHKGNLDLKAEIVMQPLHGVHVALWHS